MTQVKGRDWKWWIITNSHNCRFCHEQGRRVSLGGEVVRLYGIGMSHPDYWRRLYQVWLAHMKKYHPELLGEVKGNPGGPIKGDQAGMLGVPGKVHVQKRPYSIGQEELEDYGKYKRAMLIEYDKQYSLEQLREMCRAKGYSASGDKKTLIGRLI